MERELNNEVDFNSIDDENCGKQFTAFFKPLAYYIAFVSYHFWQVVSLSVKLMRFVGIGYKWFVKFIRLVIFGALLTPAWFNFGRYYLSSKRILKNVTYGVNPRNVMDVYLPTEGIDLSTRRPVAVVVWGGAWIIGYKLWSGIICRSLSEQGMIVLAIDYRNFPQGVVGDMLDDLDSAMSWTFRNIESYGGDVDNIHIISQSAGAHLSILGMLRQSHISSRKWDSSRIKNVIAISGVYNLPSNIQSFHKHGLYEGLFKNIMNNEIEKYSPYQFILENFGKESVEYSKEVIPPITLVHGTTDKTVSSTESEEFSNLLNNLGISSEVKIYEGKSHTDLFLEDQLVSSNGIYFIHYLLGKIMKGSNYKLNLSQVNYAPVTLVKLARRINPF